MRHHVICACSFIKLACARRLCTYMLAFLRCVAKIFAGRTLISLQHTGQNLQSTRPASLSWFGLLASRCAPRLSHAMEHNALADFVCGFVGPSPGLHFRCQPLLFELRLVFFWKALSECLARGAAFSTKNDPIPQPSKPQLLNFTSKSEAISPRMPRMPTSPVTIVLSMGRSRSLHSSPGGRCQIQMRS